MDCKLASLALSLMKIKLWVHLENWITNLDTHWLQFWGNLCAWFHYLTEVIIVHAVQIASTEVILPLFSKYFEGLLWDSEVWAACIDNGRPLLFLNKVKLITVVKHISAFESPLLHRVHPLWPVSHSLDLLEPTHASYNLVLVEAAENSVWGVVRLWACDAETHNSLIDKMTVL